MEKIKIKIITERNIKKSFLEILSLIIKKIKEREK
jgi:hypothetical protein